MIKKLALALVCSAVFIAASAQATTGIFGGYIVLDINGAGDTFYRLENPGDTTNPAFNGTNLGTFDPDVNSLFFSGGEALTFKNSGGDVTGAAIYYRIFETGNPTGSFNSANLPFAANIGGTAGNEDQRWQSFAPNDNLLFGLAPGNYTLQTYVDATTNEGTRFLNNGGANYSASFTVVPEPSSLSLLAGPAILGAWFFVRRRRA
jgi:hypothetical protein